MCGSPHLALKTFIANNLVLNNAYLLFAITSKKTLDLYGIVANILVKAFIAKILVLNNAYFLFTITPK